MTATAAKAAVADPVSVELTWQRLVAAADEAATALVRTSFSPIVRESNDFSCVIFDSRGNAVAENTIGIPSFNVTLSHTLRHMLRWRPAREWRQGDVAITNDPWLATGHLPDVTMVMPIFGGDRLVAWTGSIAHQADIGGSGWTPDSSDVYQEGLRVPPMLLQSEGRLNDDLMRLLRANVRLADEVVGDLMAQVSAGRVAERRVRDLMRDGGLDGLDDIGDQMFELADAAMRRAVLQLPDGTYRSTLELDGDGERPVHLEAAVVVGGDEILVDYQGTSSQVGYAINSVLNYTEAYTCYPLKCVLDPLSRRNEGSYRCLRVRAPEGSVLNPHFPAPVNARQLVGHCLAGLLLRALAPALPAKVLAESGSAPTLRVVISGVSHAGRRFNSILFINGGMGASAAADGLSATCFPSNVVCGSMEMIEALAPIRVWRKELATDSGGPGRQRGGCGQEVEIELVGDQECTVALFVERLAHPAKGLLGGHPGTPAAVVWNGRRDGFRVKGRNRMVPGDRICIRYPGGGGFGDPRERAREAVSADIRSGLISEQAARGVYGDER